MARFIDADILRKNEIARCHCVPCVGSDDNNYKDLDEVLNDCPAPDVVEVVRCRDCKYSRPLNTTKSPEKYFIPTCVVCECEDAVGDESMIYLGDHFCSYGERKGGD